MTVPRYRFHGDPCTRCQDEQRRHVQRATHHSMCSLHWLGATEAQRRAALDRRADRRADPERRPDPDRRGRASGVGRMSAVAVQAPAVRRPLSRGRCRRRGSPGPSSSKASPRHRQNLSSTGAWAPGRAPALSRPPRRSNPPASSFSAPPRSSRCGETRSPTTPPAPGPSGPGSSRRTRTAAQPERQPPRRSTHPSQHRRAPPQSAVHGRRQLRSRPRPRHARPAARHPLGHGHLRREPQARGRRRQDVTPGRADHRPLPQPRRPDHPQTGTLMPHSALSLYGQFRALDPDVLGTSWSAFKARYAAWRVKYYLEDGTPQYHMTPGGQPHPRRRRPRTRARAHGARAAAHPARLPSRAR